MSGSSGVHVGYPAHDDIAATTFSLLTFCVEHESVGYSSSIERVGNRDTMTNGKCRLVGNILHLHVVVRLEPARHHS